MRCRECRAAYLDPRPSPQTIELAYRSYYTHGAATPPPPVGRIRQALANDYRRARWGYVQGPAITGGRLIPRLAPSRAAIVDREVRHLHATPGGRLLDVGCGSGGFLLAMAALGWRVEGIDPDPAAVAGAREAGLRVTQGTLADLDPSEHACAFNAVTLSHVIEHLHDPTGDLRRVNAVLRPGGLLWIATPNLEALGLRRFGRDWRGLEPPRHLVLFTRASLERLVRRAGLSRSRLLRPRRWPGRCSARVRRLRRVGSRTRVRRSERDACACLPRSPIRSRTAIPDTQKSS